MTQTFSEYQAERRAFAEKREREAEQVHPLVAALLRRMKKCECRLPGPEGFVTCGTCEQDRELCEPYLKSMYRDNNASELAGEELPYPELAHEHRWNAELYCNECGQDGAA